MNIFYPTINKPYKIETKKPIVLKTACMAGINRSATTREWLKTKINQNSIIYNQYGAYYGDYHNSDIVAFAVNKEDGFNSVFGTSKQPNVQTILFKFLGYSEKQDFVPNTLKPEDKDKYRKLILKNYWLKEYDIPQVYVLINEHETIINKFINQMKKYNYKGDLVILNLEDTIYKPQNGIKPQSEEAYRLFISKLEKLIT